MKFPWTPLAIALFPLWALKRGLLSWRRFTVSRSSVDRWFDEVDPSLVVGGALFPGDLDALRARGVGAILSLCAEYVDPPCDGLAMHRIAVHDDLPASAEQIKEGVRWIDERVAAGAKVYVHCAAGRGRSVSVACAWLVRRHGLSTDEALARIQAVRPCARPARWQIAAVRKLEPELRSAKS